MKIKIVASVILWVCALSVSAIDAESLKQSMAENNRLVLIDLRPAPQYKNNHIVGAINIPFKILHKKKLPPFKHVVLYDDGLLSNTALQAKEIVARHMSGRIEILEGGFRAWRISQLDKVSKNNGISLPEIMTINYHKPLGERRLAN